MFIDCSFAVIYVRVILKVYIVGGQRSVASHNLLHQSHERNHIPCGWLKVLYMQVPMQDEWDTPVVTRECKGWDQKTVSAAFLYILGRSLWKHQIVKSDRQSWPLVIFTPPQCLATFTFTRNCIRYVANLQHNINTYGIIGEVPFLMEVCIRFTCHAVSSCTDITL